MGVRHRAENDILAVKGILWKSKKQIFDGNIKIHLKSIGAQVPKFCFFRWITNKTLFESLDEFFLRTEMVKRAQIIVLDVHHESEKMTECFEQDVFHL